MSNTTRPIPISVNRTHSQRSSPVNMGEQSDSTLTSLSSANSTMISQSCPVNGHIPTFLSVQHQPPRAPVIGSLPEPTFMSTLEEDRMPELILPPPAQPDESTPQRGSSILEFARSCPGDIGYMRQGLQPPSRSWLPSPRTMDEFDLSKSPALAVMFAMREARPLVAHPNLPTSMTDRSSARVLNPRHFFREEEEEVMEEESPPIHGRRLTATSLAMARLSLTRSPRQENDLHSNELHQPSERRGSYDGGVFHFEEQ